MPHYPFRADAYFPRNVWYIAAKCDEVGQGLLGRTFFDERVLLYRTSKGEVTALAGLCPHRFLPLEKGVRIRDAVQCGYHGITFDENGACIRIPSQEEIPERCRLNKYPTIERGGFVWIWMGDPDRANASLMPDLAAAGLEGDDWSVTANPVFHFKARAQLVVDNLFDLTHVPFSHATGGQFVAGDDDEDDGSFMALDPGLMGPLKVTTSDGRLVAWREVKGAPPPPTLPYLFPSVSAPRIDYAIGTEMLSPALINAAYTDVWIEPGAEPLRLNFVHGITPETATTTHLFLATTRNYDLDNDQLSAVIPIMNGGIVQQDIAIYEATEPYLDRKSARDELIVTADAGAIQARRILERMMAEE
jgi:phenylpropionate dioxygenase-like ring-hydroxylating dioxygenase large terminal subunit